MEGANADSTIRADAAATITALANPAFWARSLMLGRTLGWLPTDVLVCCVQLSMACSLQWAVNSRARLLCKLCIGAGGNSNGDVRPLSRSQTTAL